MRRYAILTAVTLLALDQFIKYTLVTKGIFISFVVPWVNIRVTKNAGIAFSVPFPGTLLVVLSILVIVVTLILLIRQKTSSTAHLLGFGLFLGGALGNLADRIFRGAVIDYLNIFTGSINLADVAIIAGLALFLFFPRLPKQKEGDTVRDN